MKGQKHKAGKKHSDPYSTPLPEAALEPAGEVEVVYQEVPPTPPEGKKIHKRRPLPPTPEGPAEDANEAK